MKIVLAFIFVTFLVTPLFADQAMVVDKHLAFRAGEKINENSEIKFLCEPCGETEPRTVKVSSVEVRKFSQEGEYTIVVNGRDIDLAYTYIMRDGNWQNMAKMHDFYVHDVTSCFDKEFKTAPAICFPDDLDKQLSECIRSDESTNGIIRCYSKLTTEWDKKLNEVYSRLRSEFSDTQKEALRDAQLAWIKFRDHEINFYSEFYAVFDGSMFGMFQAADIMNVTKNRTKTMMSTLNAWRID